MEDVKPMNEKEEDYRPDTKQEDNVGPDGKDDTKPHDKEEAELVQNGYKEEAGCQKELFCYLSILLLSSSIHSSRSSNSNCPE